MTPGSERRQAILHKIESCVCKDRQSSYGDAEDNFANIAELWNIWLRVRYVAKGSPEGNQELTAADVAGMCALIKVARAAHNVTVEDNWIDMAGYAVCGAGIIRSTAANDGFSYDPNHNHMYEPKTT